MPGNLQGIRSVQESTDLQIEEVALQSFGMINVSLQDENGGPLNILDGWNATIRVAIPDDIAADAPDQIPLWSYNDQFGIWIEDGTANKVNGQYIGQVSHFSWGNCDAPFPVVELDLTLVDQNSNPISDHLLAVGLGSNSIASYYSYTNNKGFVNGKVPFGEELLIQIHGFCGDIIYSTLVGPFTEDTSLGNIIVNDPNVNNTEITGSIVDCIGSLISNGGIMVEIGNQNFITQVENGTYDIFISACSGPTDLTVTALDFDASVQSEPVNGTVGTIVNTGAMEVCLLYTSPSPRDRG